MFICFHRITWGLAHALLHVCETTLNHLELSISSSTHEQGQQAFSCSPLVNCAFAAAVSSSLIGQLLKTGSLIGLNSRGLLKRRMQRSVNLPTLNRWFHRQSALSEGHRRVHKDSMSSTDMSAVIDILRSLYLHMRTLEEFADSFVFREGQRAVLVEQTDSDQFKSFVRTVYVCSDKELEQIPSCSQVRLSWMCC